MIHVFIGTKAQFIKTAPVLLELHRRGFKYNYIDSGQHAHLTAKLRKLFQINDPDVFLRNSREDITSLAVAVGWALSSFFQALLFPGRTRKSVFRGRGGVCIVHGDTLSTVLGMFLAKRSGLKVAHIEAGLRSFNILNPFPEELIRLLTMKKADYLFAPSDWAYKNLESLNVEGEKINMSGNTVLDAIRHISSQGIKTETPYKKFVVVTIHRFETLYSRKRLKQILGILRKISKKLQVLFVMHEPTKKRLTQYGLLEHFQEAAEIVPMQEYSQFLALIQKAEFIITDGGSIQEESFYLNVPCLVMRKKTERLEGIGANVYLSEFDSGRIDFFIERYREFSNKDQVFNKNPSSRIVDYLQKYA
jgi:UDP-N-acetylglucosamine 2-epimerase